ncbi:MAG: SGNH/GDSL hydrolase family protein [Candidatus Hydrogenedentes bacterium]|nr:SGNH/GDSL hydrolase family protein [Candidatus Hydrogenedentota bacterium]
MQGDQNVPVAGPARTQKRSWRAVVLLVVGLALVGGLVGYLRYFATFRFWIPPPVGSGPAGPDVPREPFARVWSSEPVVLLGIGDSVTAGFGASPGLSYFERLAANPPSEFPDMEGICLSAVLSQLKSVNISVSGSDSIQHLEDQLANLPPFPSDTRGIVVVTTGGNDLIHWYGRGTPREGAMYGTSLEQAQPWIENFRVRLNAMMDRLDQAFPGGVQIFLATIYDPSDEVGDPAAAGLPPWPELLAVHAAYNDVIREVAEQRDNVHLVDMRQAFLGHGVHCVQWWREHYDRSDPHYWYYGNLEDPNDRGYDAIRRLFLLKMIAVVPEWLAGGEA